MTVLLYVLSWFAAQAAVTYLSALLIVWEEGDYGGWTFRERVHMFWREEPGAVWVLLFGFAWPLVIFGILFTLLVFWIGNGRVK